MLGVLMNEISEAKKEETLLDLDFDPFKPEAAPITPGTEADVAAGILVSAAEGAPVEEAELEKAALPAGEGASAEEAKVDTETTEVVDSDQPQLEDTEAVVPQASVLVHVHGGSAELGPELELCLLGSGDEKVIPSVVIEPAFNNEGEGEHEITIGVESKEVTDDTAFPSKTPELASEQKAGEAPQLAPSMQSASEASQEMPPGFLYKVTITNPNSNMRHWYYSPTGLYTALGTCGQLYDQVCIRTQADSGPMWDKRTLWSSITQGILCVPNNRHD
ncbi:Amphiphysin [Galemys pyrenaicus]|uniref:Amphiphysin n=1 Tax=Galemys pyrenaicus TaxID=202257 RepID=A0A8J5ZYN9_GALPY|nr:Amphiphysin [Galemys pyrenaicus]